MSKLKDTNKQTRTKQTKNQRGFCYFILDGYAFSLTSLSDTYEPRHDKTNIMGLRPAWIQTSLRIRAV
jgi:hypothetical protein